MSEKMPMSPEKPEEPKIKESSSVADSVTDAFKKLPIGGWKKGLWGNTVYDPNANFGLRASVKVNIDKPPVTPASEEENLARLKNALKNKPGNEWLKDAFKEPRELKEEHEVAWHESYNRYLKTMAELVEEESLAITPIDHSKLTQEWLNKNKDVKTFDQLQEKPSLRNLEDMTPEEIDARVAELEKFKKGFEIKV
ncbi:MAG: hypothetical protein V1928_01150 [Parcubacteria group bacterium]